MKDSEYLEQLFLEYLPTMDALNELTSSLYSKDEYKLRHKVFKRIYAEYNVYKIKLLIAKLKNKIVNFKEERQKKRIDKIVKDYKKLQESGLFLPKK